MSPAAQIFDMGGTPLQNAALAVIMVATMGGNNAGPGPHLIDQATAAGVTADLLQAAAGGGFASNDEFRALVGAGAMTPRLERLAVEVAHLAGGPEKIFNMLAMAVTPAGEMGAQQ